MLRVSQETGFISVMVRHNGVAAPHNHIGGSDFLVLEGALGVRAGPPGGYGPGTWFYEPSGARHDATQRVSDDDLIYTANITDAYRGSVHSFTMCAHHVLFSTLLNCAVKLNNVVVAYIAPASLNVPLFNLRCLNISTFWCCAAMNDCFSYDSHAVINLIHSSIVVIL